MNHQYSEDILEKVERYLAGEMPEEELQTFESEIAKDETLQQLIAHHRSVIEALQFSAYKEDKENWMALQESIKTEETSAINTLPETLSPKPQKNLGLLILLLLAGIILGIIGASLYEAFKTPSPELPKKEIPIADNEEEEEITLGFNGEKITREIPFTLIQKNNERLAMDTTRQMFLQVDSSAFPNYVLLGNNLTLYLPKNDMKVFANSRVKWTVKIEKDTLHFLNIADHWFQLFPSKDKQWLGSIPEKNIPNPSK